MSRRPVIISQADVARVLRAAQQAGASRVKIRPDGTIVIFLVQEEKNGQAATNDIDEGPPIVF